MKDMGTSSGVETSIELPCAANPRASVIIPTASQADMLSRCLRSLASNVSQAMPYEVIVVLNAATDEVRDLVLHHTNGVRVIDSPANLGVAGGYNRGRSVALGQYGLRCLLRRLISGLRQELSPAWCSIPMGSCRVSVPFSGRRA